MEQLRLLGLDVQSRKGRSAGWFVGARDFELMELKLLMEAVQASRFLSQRKSDALIKKLSTLTSRHQAQHLKRQVYVTGRIKSMNETIYYAVDKLHTAIAGQKVITFRYFYYNVRKEKVFRHGGRRYTVTPFALLWDNENYYLAAYDHGSESVRNYRVDKMEDIAVTTLPPQGRGEREGFDPAQYAQRRFGMFGGEEIQVTLQGRSDMVGVVLDRFGQDIILVPHGEDAFTTTVPVVVSPQFFGWLCGLGGGVVITRPAGVVRQYKAHLEQQLTPYQEE